MRLGRGWTRVRGPLGSWAFMAVQHLSFFLPARCPSLRIYLCLDVERLTFYFRCGRPMGFDDIPAFGRHSRSSKHLNAKGIRKEVALSVNLPCLPSVVLEGRLGRYFACFQSFHCRFSSRDAMRSCSMYLRWCPIGGVRCPMADVLGYVWMRRDLLGALWCPELWRGVDRTPHLRSLGLIHSFFGLSILLFSSSASNLALSDRR